MQKVGSQQYHLYTIFSSTIADNENNFSNESMHNTFQSALAFDKLQSHDSFLPPQNNFGNRRLLVAELHMHFDLNLSNTFCMATFLTTLSRKQL